ncbi:MAG: DNA-directed RNA polymerase subunit omega [Acidobacteria bacterium]|nr:DNA-directed RNA polymerase subunit omega [Acidobacteriota bacterium]
MAMDTNESQNQAEEAIDSKYRKILIAAKRSKQLQRGARPRVSVGSAKPTRIALEEVEQGKVEFEVIERSED